MFFLNIRQICRLTKFRSVHRLQLEPQSLDDIITSLFVSNLVLLEHPTNTIQRCQNIRRTQFSVVRTSDEHNLVLLEHPTNTIQCCQNNRRTQFYRFGLQSVLLNGSAVHKKHHIVGKTVACALPDGDWYGQPKHIVVSKKDQVNNYIVVFIGC